MYTSSAAASRTIGASWHLLTFYYLYVAVVQLDGYNSFSRLLRCRACCWRRSSRAFSANVLVPPHGLSMCLSPPDSLHTRLYVNSIISETLGRVDFLNGNFEGKKQNAQFKKHVQTRPRSLQTHLHLKRQFYLKVQKFKIRTFLCCCFFKNTIQEPLAQCILLVGRQRSEREWLKSRWVFITWT